MPNSNAITPPTPPSLALASVTSENNLQRAANATPTNSNVQQSIVSKNNGISISPLGSLAQPQLEVQLPSDGSQQQMLQLPQFNSQFVPGNGATFVPLQNSIHPASGAFDHLTLEEQKPDLSHLNNQSQNAIIYPSDDGMGSLPGGGNQSIAQGGAQVVTKTFDFLELNYIIFYKNLTILQFMHYILIFSIIG